MKVRFKFTKTGRLKYIGHLDVLNIWNRAVKSAGLPVSYSKGFNPHMLMSFAAPLPLGLTSLSEYVDVDFDDDTEICNAPQKINARFPEGMEITGSYVLEAPYKRVAALVEQAEYMIKTHFEPSDNLIDTFLARETVQILKKTKSKNEITDIMPDIFSVKKTDDGILAVLSCGSARNLKPTLFIQAFCEICGLNEPLHSIGIERTEIYGRANSGQFEPLSKLLI